MRFLKTFLNEYASWKWSVLLLLMLPYGWSTRSSAVSDANMHHLSLNQWDVLFPFLGNGFITFFVYLPSWLLISNYFLLNSWDLSLLIRLKSFPNWLFYIVRNMFTTLLAFLCLWLTVGFTLTLGLTYESRWSEYASMDTTINYITFTLHNTGFQIWILLLLQASLMGLFMMALQIIITAVHIFIPSSKTVGLISVILTLICIIGYRKMPEEYAFWNPFNFISLSPAKNNMGSIWVAFVVLIVIIMTSILTVNIKMRRLTRNRGRLLSDKT